MELVLGTTGFATPGGSETYLLTIAEQLQRLGHEVTIYAHELGAMSDLATARGLRVTASTDRLPDSCDAAVVQDAAVAYQLADRLPMAPQLFRAPSDLYDFQLPPNLPDLVGAVVVLSDRVEKRAKAAAPEHRVVRLRQPVDTERFRPNGPIARKPRRAVLLGNYLRGPRRERLLAALQANGIEAHQVGAPAASALEPERAIWTADIVVAKGRAVLEGMACGRAVYVYDEFGADGWVTAESYPQMEADNFAGQATDMTVESGGLREDLARYNAEMGLVNRDLAARNHGARYHADSLSMLLKELAPPATAPEPQLTELARLVRLQWQTAGRVLTLERAQADARTESIEMARRYDEVVAERDHLRAVTATRRHRAGMRAGQILDGVRDVVRRVR
jgi:hypothetical protein